METAPDATGRSLVRSTALLAICQDAETENVTNQLDDQSYGR